MARAPRSLTRKGGTTIPAILILAVTATAGSGAALAVIRLRGRAVGGGGTSDRTRPEPTRSMPQGPDRRPLPEQFSPLPPNRIWSDYAGTWHPLNLESREVYRDSAPRSPVLGVTCVALLCAASTIRAAAVSHRVSVPSTIVFLGLPTVVLAVLTIRLALRRGLPKRLVLQGKVVRLQPAAPATARAGRPAPARLRATLDVGRAPASVRLDLGPRTYQGLRVGDVVEVAVRPRRKVISGLRNLGTEPGSQATDEDR